MDNLKVLGSQLFDLWLAESWDKVKARIPAGATRLLVIASDAPDLLNLPWELMRPPDGDFFGFDAKYSIRRLPRANESLAPFAGSLPPRPLRILFMACSPKDQPPLDYEREEESLLFAIAGAGGATRGVMFPDRPGHRSRQYRKRFTRSFQYGFSTQLHTGSI